MGVISVLDQRVEGVARFLVETAIRTGLWRPPSVRDGNQEKHEACRDHLITLQGLAEKDSSPDGPR